MSKLRVWRLGVIGTGRMAATMMECFALSSRIAAVCVAANDEARSSAFAGEFGLEACSSVSKLLDRADIDAVYIANATSDHAATAIAALAAGKAVLCEKPFAMNVSQGWEVAAAAAKYRRLFVEAQWTPSLPAYQELRRLVGKCELGMPVHLRSDFGLCLDPRSNRRLFEGEGSGVLLDFGVYPIVLALHLLGPVQSVRACVSSNACGTDVQASLQLAHDGGGHSQLAVSLIANLSNESVLSCSNGLVRFASPVMGTESLRVSQAFGSAPPTHRVAKHRLVAALRKQPLMRRLKESLAIVPRSTFSYGTNRYLPQLLHFVALLDCAALTSDLMPIQTSLDVLRVIDSARLNNSIAGIESPP